MDDAETKFIAARDVDCRTGIERHRQVALATLGQIPAHDRLPTRRATIEKHISTRQIGLKNTLRIDFGELTLDLPCLPKLRPACVTAGDPCAAKAFVGQGETAFLFDPEAANFRQRTATPRANDVDVLTRATDIDDDVATLHALEFSARIGGVRFDSAYCRQACKN